MKFFYCKNCLMPSTRPRVLFNKEGICNGCEWTEAKKKKIDWKARWKELEELCDRYRSARGDWDVIVPCSAGKDSYYIAWSMKYRLKMHPLLVTFSPLISTEIGRRNLDNLIKHGFDHLQINPDGRMYRGLCRKGLIEQGRPQLAFETGITTAVLKLAMAMKIPFLMYGEEGESEYGGSMEYAHKAKFDRDWAVRTYFSGRDTSEYKNEFSEEELKWWHFPSQNELKKEGVFLTHWSYFENWNHILHYKVAKQKLGFQELKRKDINNGVTGYATHTNYTSLDDPFMRTFHTYLMFLKFGFGRGTQEASNDIKAGLMSRDEGIRIAKRYDSYDCADFRDKLMDVFDMGKKDFLNTLDKWANKAILEKVNGKWQLKKWINHRIFIENAVEIDYPD